MTITIGALLALSFLISVLGLFMFIWAQMNGLMKAGSDASEVIFAKGEVGVAEDPSLSVPERAALQHVASGERDGTSLQNLAASPELEARVEAVLRRTSQVRIVEPPLPPPDQIHVGELVIDRSRRRVTIGGDPIQLTPTEWRILDVLLRHQGRCSEGLDRGRMRCQAR